MALNAAQFIPAVPVQLPEILTSQQVADYLGYSVKSIKSLVCRGKLPSVKINGRVRFLAADIASLIEAGRRPVRSE